MTDTEDRLVERVARAIWYTDCGLTGPILVIALVMAVVVAALQAGKATWDVIGVMW